MRENFGALPGWVVSALLVCALCMPLSVLAGEPDRPAVPKKLPPDDFVPGEVLVLTADNVNRNGKAAAAANPNDVEKSIPGKVTRKMHVGKGKNVLRVSLPKGKSVQAAIGDKWGQADARILAVEPNYIVHIQSTPDDTRYPEMWSLNNTGQTGGTPDADIDAPEAWDTTTGSSSVIVAVIDTGVDYLHPDLIDNMWHNPGESGGGKETNGIDDDNNGYVDDVYGYDFVMHDSDPSDAHSHGTHVSGTIAGRGNSALGVTGINWNCKIMACRFLNASGSGNIADAILAVNYAVANGAKVLNNSWGGGGYLATMQAAIENARDHGVLFVAAAGNAAADNDTNDFYPANYPVSNVIAVAATTHTDALASFSNFGDMSVHLGAPGQSILSSVPHFVTLFAENFQGATPPGFSGTQMTVEGPTPRWGTAASPVGASGNIAARGDYANSLPYLSGSDGSLVTPTMDTRGLRGLSVTTLVRIDAGTGDSLSIDVWNGNTWITLLSITYSGLYQPYYFYFQAEVPENYRAIDSRFRWRWISDSVDNTHEGVEIDDINISYIGGDYTNSYALFSGTSMATPHVVGVAALALAADPTLTLEGLKYRLLYSGDPIPALQGKTITGRRLNANGAIQPVPPTAFDVADQTYTAVPVTITLSGADDGQPGPLQFVISSLPMKGALSDPLNGPITAAPYMLSGNTVSYTSQPNVNGEDTFQFMADDGGSPPNNGSSAPATVTITILNCFFFDDFSSTTLNTSNWTGPTVTVVSTSLSPPSPPYAMRLDGEPNSSESVVSRVMDLSALHGAELRYSFEQGGSQDQPDPGEDLIFEYLTAANTWVELSRHYGVAAAMTTFEAAFVYLPEPAFHPNFQLRIRDIASQGPFDVWYVDDICIQEAPDQPPIASSTSIGTATDTPLTIAMEAFDPNRDPLTYIVTSLPGSGTLSDPQAGAISTVPYTLTGGGNAVVYSPTSGFDGSDSFQFKANDGHAPPLGGDSNIAKITIAVVNCLPVATDNPTPADAATNVSHNPTLTWGLSILPDNLITFDEASYGQIVNGMVIGNVTFGFSSNDAIIDGGPGNTLYVHTPNIEGDRTGTLTLNFAVPVAGVSYGFVLSSFTPQLDATSMNIYDVNNNLLSTFSTDAADHGFSWVEGTNSGDSPLGIAKAVITFSHPDAVRFAFDDLELTPMPGGAIAGAAQSNPSKSGSSAIHAATWPIPTASTHQTAAMAAAKNELEASVTTADPEAAAALPDFCTSPQNIIGASPIMITASGTNAATVSPTDPSMPCVPGQNSNTLWYQIVPAQAGSMRIQTCGSNYDTVVAVWNGTCGIMTALGCNDDSSCGLASDLTVMVQAGMPYLIEVADYSGPGGGELVMTVSGIDAVCTTPTTYSVLLDHVNPPTTPVCQNLTSFSCDPGTAVRAATTYYWRVQSQNCCGTTLGPVWSFSTGTPADFDGDGDVDQSDFAHLQLCLRGTGTAQNDPTCQDAKLNTGDDVDNTDVILFLNCLNGPNIPPPVGCME